MNANTMIKHLTRSAALACLLSLAACGSDKTSPEASDPPLAGADIGGDFNLVDQNDNPRNWADFNGRYRIVYFGYAFCPDVCPLDVQSMVKGLALFGKQDAALAAQIQPIFITIDPLRDTPSVIGEFTRAFSDDLVGLTGTPEQIKKAANAFAVYYKKGEDSPGGGYLMDHSRAAFLMGRDGQPIALLPVDQGPKAVAAELGKWVH
jgi:protein SCO1